MGNWVDSKVSFQALAILEIVLNAIFLRSFQQRSKQSEASKFCFILSSLTYMLTFSWIMAPCNGTFWLSIFKNHFKKAASNVSWDSAISTEFWCFTFCPSSSDEEILCLFLTRVDIFLLLHTLPLHLYLAILSQHLWVLDIFLIELCERVYVFSQSCFKTQMGIGM